MVVPGGGSSVGQSKDIPLEQHYVNYLHSENTSVALKKNPIFFLATFATKTTNITQLLRHLFRFHSSLTECNLELKLM